MIINFRQGIINAQVNNNFLQLVGGKININVDMERLDLAFAYGSHDYLFTESESVTGAWGPFTTGVDSYLYWDINMVTGVRTFGLTNYAPTVGSTFPANPSVNQHHFDYTDRKMKVWNGVSWEEKLRVFSAKVASGGILQPEDLGSQVGLNGVVSLGYILFDDKNNPLRVTDGSGRYYFLTTEDKIHTQQDIHNAYKIDSILMDGRAIEPIGAYHCVTWKGPKQLGTASYVDYTRPCVGISIEASGINEVKQFITKGFVTNYNNWNWTQPPNTPLFVGDAGQVTTDVPQQYSLQKIGHVVSNDTAFIDIQEIVLIENILPSPTPSVTPTLSVSVSVSLSPSITPTPSVTRTAQATMTPTPTVTQTMQASLSPTPTPTASHTISVTPTITMSATPIASITPTPTASAIVSEFTDAIALFYQNPNPLPQSLQNPMESSEEPQVFGASQALRVGDSTLAMSIFDGVTRTDIGDVALTWGNIDGGGNENIGDKNTLKLRKFGSGINTYLSVNTPISAGIPGSGSPLYISAHTTGYDVENVENASQTEFSPTIDTAPPSAEGGALYVYAIDQVNKLEYGGWRYPNDSSIGYNYFLKNGKELTVQSGGIEGYTGMGCYGMDVLQDNTAFMLAFNSSGAPSLIKMVVSNVDESSLTADVSYVACDLQSSDEVPVFDDSDIENVNGEIYEVKSFGSKDYISVSANVNSVRQSYLTTSGSPTSRQSYVLTYNQSSGELQNAYVTPDSGYISVTDNYFFSLNNDTPENNNFDGNLNIRQIDADNNVTDILNYPLTRFAEQGLLGPSMPAADARIRTVKSNANTITVYTFGFGIYMFDVNTQTVTFTNDSDIWADNYVFGIKPSSSNFFDYVIDTWAGSIPRVPPAPTPSA